MKGTAGPEETIAPRLDADLLERGPQIAVLGELLRDAAAGSGGIAIAEGSPGVGKSALLSRSALLAREYEPPLQVLSARGAELEQDLPFGVVMQLFEAFLGRMDGGARSRLLSGAARHARPLFADEAPSKRHQDEATLMTILHGVYWLAANIAEDRALVVVVDDAHWADVPSLRFLLYLAQRLTELPIAVLAGLRTGEKGAQRELLAQLPATARRIAIEPLSATAASELVSRELPDAQPSFAVACAEVSGGNPLLLHELLDELDRESIEPEAGQAERVRTIVPASISRLMLVRLAGLSSEAQRLAKALAILGRDPSPSHAARLAEITADELDRGVDELIEASLLAPGEPMGFVHPLVESGIRAEVSRGESSRLHRLAVELRRAEGGSPQQLASHLLQTLPSSDPEVVEILRAAAREAVAIGSPEPARDFLARALAEPPSAEERFQLLRELGEAEALAGLPGASERIAEAVSGMRRGGDRAATMLVLARQLYAEGSLAEAAETLERAFAELGDRDHSLRMQLECDFLSVGSLVPSKRAEALRRAEGLIERLQEEKPEGAEWSPLFAGAALHLALTGRDRETAVSFVESAYRDGELVASEGPEATAVNLCTGVAYIAGELDRDVEIATAAIEEARRRGSILGFAMGAYVRSGGYLRKGMVTEAIADVESAIDGRRFGWAQFLPAAYTVLIEAMIARGELDAAESRLAELDEESWGETGLWGFVQSARGRLFLAAGRYEEAIDCFREQGRLMPAPNPAFQAHWRAHWARAAVHLDRHDEAELLAGEELELTRAWGAPGPIGVSLHALGLARAGGDRIETLREAIDVLDSSQAKLDLWYALIDLGRELRHAGHRREAREPLRRVADEATRGGAFGLAIGAKEELALSGARPRRRALSGPESLTPGELRAARMAAKGMTNREIAEALFVTIKAVQWHLGNAYRKLEIDGRSELADALALAEED